MRPEYLTEFVNGLGRWLSVWEQAHRDLGRVYALLRRGLEHPGERDALEEAIRKTVDLLVEYDPERFGSVVKFFPMIRFEDHDVRCITRFLRAYRPGEDDAAEDLLEWLGQYHAVVGIAIRYVEGAQLDIILDQGPVQGAAVPGNLQQPTAPRSSATEADPSGPIAPRGARPGAERLPDKAGDTARPAGYLGLTLDEGTDTIRRAGRVVVRFGARAKLSPRLFKLLWERGEGGCPVEYLAAHWEDLGGEDNNPENDTIADGVYRMNLKLRPEGLEGVREQDRYILKELVSNNAG